MEEASLLAEINMSRLAPSANTLGRVEVAKHVDKAMFTEQPVEPLAVPALQEGSGVAGIAGVKRKGADVEVTNEEDGFACCLACLHAQLQGLQAGSNIIGNGQACRGCK